LGNLSPLAPGEHTLYLTGLSSSAQTLYIGAKNAYKISLNDKEDTVLEGTMADMVNVNLDAAVVPGNGTVTPQPKAPGHTAVAPAKAGGQAPQTGDSSNMVLYLGAALTAALLAVALLLPAKRRRSS